MKRLYFISHHKADIATRKQCKYAHACSKRLPVKFPRTPKISNYVEGLRVHRTLKMSASVLTLADKSYQGNGLLNTSNSFGIDDTKQPDSQLASNAK